MYVGYEIIPLQDDVEDANPTLYEVTVYGYAGLKNSYGFYPFINISVDIINVGTWSWTATVTTSNNGFFQYERGDPYDEPDIYLRFNLSSNIVEIRREGTVYYAQMEYDYPNIPWGSEYSIYLSDEDGDGLYEKNENEYYYVTPSNGTAVRYIIEETLVVRNVNLDANGHYYVSDPNPAAAAMIFWYIQQAALFFYNEVGEIPPKIIVEFSDSYASTYYDPSNDILYVSGDPNKRDWEDISLILKEYAKHILKHCAYEGSLPSSTGFSWDQHTDEQTAWIEGFGAYFASTVKDYTGLPEPYLYDDYPNEYNLETQYDYDSSRNDQDVCGAVAGLLWDLWDSQNDDQDSDGYRDTLSLSFSQMWQVIDDNDITDVITFLNDLKNTYGLDEKTLWEAGWEHGINIDNEPPTVRISSPSNNSYIASNDVTVTWTGNDNTYIDHYEICLDSGNWINVELNTSYTFTGLSNGVHEVSVKAYDVPGNYNVTTVVFTVDTIPPLVSITSPNNGTYLATSNVTVSWSGSDNIAIDHFEIRVDGSSWINVGLTYSYEFTGLSDGSHTVDVKAVDKAGNTNISSVTFYVDTTPPQITILYPSDNEYLSTTNITVEWSGNDNIQIDHYETRVDGGSWLSVGLNTSYNLYNLPEGQHVVEVRVIDKAGNEGMDNVTFYIDITPPNVQITEPTNNSYIPSENITVKWNGSDNFGIDHYEIKIDDSSWINVGLNTTYNFTGLAEGCLLYTSPSPRDRG